MAKVITKNSFTPGSAPSGLSAGELAVNVADKKIFVGNAVGGVVTLHDQNAVVTSVNGSTGAVTNLNAASATITNTNSSATWYPTFVGGTGNTAFFIDAVSTPLTYVPSSGTVSARAFDATFATNQVKLDSALGSIFNTDGTNTNTVVAYGFEYNGASPYFISSGNQGIFLVTQGLRISDGDYDQIYGPSTWGYTFPAANGTSGQAMFTNGDGQLYWGTVTSGSASGVLSINGATGAITNVAKTNEGNTFSVRQVMNAGITTSNLFVTSGSTFTSKIESTSTSDNIDIVATTDGAGIRIAKATTGANSRVGGIRLGRSATVSSNVYLEGSVGIFTVYQGVGDTGTNMFRVSNSQASFGVPVVGPTFNSAPTSDGGYRITSNAINALTGTTYALLAADNGKVITWSNASGVTLTVPSGLPVGFNTTVIQIGAGAVGITGSGTTLNSFEGKLRTAGQHAAVSIISYTSNVFNIAGGLTA